LRIGGGHVFGQNGINGMALPPIIKCGSDYLKNLIVRDVIQGKKIFASQSQNQKQEVMSQILKQLLEGKVITTLSMGQKMDHRWTLWRLFHNCCKDRWAWNGWD